MLPHKHHHWIFCEHEHAPRGPVEIIGERGGKPIRIRLTEGRWGVAVRPNFPPSYTRLYKKFIKKLRKGAVRKGENIFSELLAKVEASDNRLEASWLCMKMGDFLYQHNQWDDSAALYSVPVLKFEILSSTSLLYF